MTPQEAQKLARDVAVVVAERQQAIDALERIENYPYTDSVPAARGMRVIARSMRVKLGEKP